MAKSPESEGKVYVVTGANKGIGLCIVRGLCKEKKDADVVYLCSRYAIAALRLSDKNDLLWGHKNIIESNNDSKC